eukprot:7384566-Prymnesium_polylepis.1
MCSAACAAHDGPGAARGGAMPHRVGRQRVCPMRRGGLEALERRHDGAPLRRARLWVGEPHHMQVEQLPRRAQRARSESTARARAHRGARERAEGRHAPTAPGRSLHARRARGEMCFRRCSRRARAATLGRSAVWDVPGLGTRLAARTAALDAPAGSCRAARRPSG